MRDPTPVPMRRLMALRQFAPLAGVELSELAMLADNVDELVVARGTELAIPGARPSAVYLVLAGRLEVIGEPACDAVGPRAIWGLLEVLAARPATHAVIAGVDTQVLRIAAPELLELLEDSFGLMHAVLAAFAARVARLAGPASSPVVVDAAPAARLPAAPLSLVERLIVLRHHLPVLGGPLHALAGVAQAAEEVRWPAGTSVARADEPADAAILVLEGALRRGDDRVLGPGDALGALETLAGLRHRHAADTLTEVRALRCSGAALLDVLEDHTDLGLALISAFARVLIDRRG